MPFIQFNGKTYNNIEEMPANERQAFEKVSALLADKNGNGIPDFLEGDIAQKVMTAYSGNISINGQEYHSLEELPEDMKNRIRSAFGLLSNMGLVSPEGTSATVTQVQSTHVEPKQPAVSRPFTPKQTPSVMEEDRGSNIFALSIGLVVLCFVLAVAAFAAFYFLGR